MNLEPTTPQYRSALLPQEVTVGVDIFDGSVASPVAVLRQEPLSANIIAMQRWCDARGVKLAPHGKTTLAPALLRRQLEAGACGITVASPAQARVAVEAGAQRVLIANEVTDVAGLRWLAALVEEGAVRVQCYVDSLDGVALMDRVLGSRLQEGTRLGVLVELGTASGRTGLRDDALAFAVAEAVVGSAHLRLEGVSGYEGVVGGAADPVGVAGVRAFCQRLVRFASTLVQSGLVAATPEAPMVVSAGGSVFFDDVAAILAEALDEPVPTEVVLRSGCYVTHDHGLYSRLTPSARGGDGPSLQPALEVWGRVLSTPEPGRAMVDVGRRDVSYDAGLPRAMWRKPASGGPSHDLEVTVSALNDQHAFLELPAGTELRVGDWVGFGVSHPCTTFDKWNVLLLADADDRLLELLATRF